MKRAAATVLLLSLGVLLRAQTLSAGGGFSGSGLLFLPAAQATPAAQFRLHAGRVDYLSSGTGGVNILELTTGFSSHLEAYIRLAGEQSGAGGSLLAPGFGGKFVLPFLVPGAGIVGFWAESHQPDGLGRGAVLTGRMARGGIVAEPFSNGIRPSFLAGVTVADGSPHPLAGASAALSVGSALQIGMEAAYGYLGAESGLAAATVHARLLPHTMLQAGAGVLIVSGRGVPMLGLGVSLATADVDFLPVRPSAAPEFRLPTIEELEKEEPAGAPEDSGEERQ